MNPPLNDNLSAARDHLLSLTITLAQLIDQRAKLVSDIQQFKKLYAPSPPQIYKAWSPQREHDVFKALFGQLPLLSDSTLAIVSLMIEIQVQQAQGEKSYPGFSQGEHLMSAENWPALKINPILALYFRPQLYQDTQLKDWAQVALFQST